MAVKFKDTININGQYTLPEQDGTVDQVLSTDGAGVISFVDLPDGEAVKIACKNTTASTITKGTPVYITGAVGASFIVQVAPADAANSAKMPAVGLLETDLAANGEGFIVTGGLLKNLTTDPIDGTTPSSNDTIYVKAGGGLTMTKPTGSNLIQNIGKVGRVNSSNAGSIVVSSILRTNDVPNLTEGKIWVGSANNTIESTVVHIDETNTRIGINQNTPDVTLDITGTDAIQIPKGTDAERPTPEAGMFRFNTTSSEFEGYNGTEWAPVGGANTASIDIDNFTGDGTTVNFTLTSEILEEDNTQVYIDGVYQSKSNYTTSGTTLTFSTAPPNGTSIEVVNFTGIAESQVDGSGTANYVTKWQDADTLANSIIYDNGTNVGIGTSNNNYKLNLSNSNTLTAVYQQFTNGTTGTTAADGTVIGIDSDGDFLINNQEAKEIKLYTSDTLRLGIDSTGNIAIDTNTLYVDAVNNRVGIGTVSPSNDVSGLHIAVASSTDQLYLERTGSGTGKWWLGTAANSLYFHDDIAASTRMVIDSSGNVGIGTTSPSSFNQRVSAPHLVVGSGSNSAGVTIYSGTVSQGSINFADGTTTTDQYMGGIVYVHGSDNYMAFNTNGSSERMRLHSTGDISFRDTSNNETFYWDASTARLGIGTNTPDANIEIDKGAEGEYLRVGGDNASNARSLRFTSSTSSGGSVGALHTIKANSIAGEIAFANGDGTIMYLKDGGNVGIGTTSPTSKLHIYTAATAGNNYYEGDLQVGGTTALLGAKLHYAAQNSGRVSLVNLNNGGGSGSTIDLGFGAIGTDGRPTNKAVSITQGGNMGIGTTSPGEKFEISGTSNVYAKVTSTNGANAGVRFNSSGVREYAIFADGDLRFYDFTAATDRMRITSGGDLMFSVNTNFGTLRQDYLSVTNGVAATVFNVSTLNSGLYLLNISRTSGSVGTRWVGIVANSLGTAIVYSIINSNAMTVSASGSNLQATIGQTTTIHATLQPLTID